MLTFYKVIAFMLIAIFINLPFGSYRMITKKFSLPWFLAIHLPIPFILVLRVYLFHLPAWVIPFSLMAAVIGQVLGGKIPLFQKVEAHSS